MKKFKADSIYQKDTTVVQDNNGKINVIWDNNDLCPQCRPETAYIDFDYDSLTLIWECETALSNRCVLGIHEVKAK